jgi:hypothetical protein
MEIKVNQDESVNGAIFWPMEGVEKLIKTTRKTRDYEGFFKKNEQIMGFGRTELLLAPG